MPETDLDVSVLLHARGNGQAGATVEVERLRHVADREVHTEELASHPRIMPELRVVVDDDLVTRGDRLAREDPAFFEVFGSERVVGAHVDGARVEVRHARRAVPRFAR